MSYVNAYQGQTWQTPILQIHSDVEPHHLVQGFSQPAIRFNGRQRRQRRRHPNIWAQRSCRAHPVTRDLRRGCFSPWRLLKNGGFKTKMGNHGDICICIRVIYIIYIYIYTCVCVQCMGICIYCIHIHIILHTHMYGFIRGYTDW